MAKSIKAAYKAIDIRSKARAEAWPEVIPPLTGEQAINATRRLYRFATGKTWKGDVKLTKGNRRAMWYYWDEQNRMFFRVNPEQGWRDLVHDLSHVFDYLTNGESEHSKHHARLEAKLVREVIRRGWLGAEPKPKVEKPEPNRHAVELERIAAREISWSRKLKRAETALKKLAKLRKYREKALAAPAKAPTERKARVVPPSAKAVAAAHGIELERLTGGGYNVWPPKGIIDTDKDPHEHDHYAHNWAEVRGRVREYANLGATNGS